MNKLNNSSQAQLNKLKLAVEAFIKQRNEIEPTNRDYIFIVNKLEREILKNTLVEIEHLPIENDDLKKLKKQSKAIKQLKAEIARINMDFEDRLSEIEIFQKPRFKFRISLVKTLQITTLVALIVMSVCSIIHTINIL